MISILTNPLNLKMLLYSEEARRLYPVAIIKCDERKEKKRRKERKKRKKDEEGRKKDLVMLFSDDKVIVMMNVLYERRIVNA